VTVGFRAAAAKAVPVGLEVTAGRAAMRPVVPAEMRVARAATADAAGDR
jgi:hypothetical protein